MTNRQIAEPSPQIIDLSRFILNEITILSLIPTLFSQNKKNLKKPYPLIMHAFCHLDTQTKIPRSNFSVSTR